MTAPRSLAASPDQVQPTTPTNESLPTSGLAVSAQPANVSDDANPIIITGSRIPRTELTAVSPVTTVNGDEFELQGATNVEELLNWLPQVNPSQGDFAPPGATGVATIDLRGLGAVRTLVLINGHRLMPGDPRYPVPDINSVPMSLIQRVEVLTGGAAAVYGSDAVAGVVNFILDTKLNGIKIGARSAPISTTIGTSSHRSCSTGGNSRIREAASSTAARKRVDVIRAQLFRQSRAHHALRRIPQDRRGHSRSARLWRLPHHCEDRRSETVVHLGMRRSERLLSWEFLRQSRQCVSGHSRPDVRIWLVPVQLRAMAFRPAAGQKIYRWRLRKFRFFQCASGIY